MVPLDALSLFSWEDLEICICGHPNLNIEILRRHTRYEGFSSDDETILMFWQMLDEFTSKERSLFLRFASGKERLTVGAKNANRMTISRLHGATDVLPQSSTCFFTVKLPR